MPINYLPNDPRAGQPPAVVVAPHAARAAGADFTFHGEIPEGLYPVGGDAFLFWQCREAALRAIALWERIDATPLTSWQQGPRLALIPRVPDEARINAYYDRASLSFFRVDGDGASYQSGASADVVAHEAGHALLDMARPDLWNAFFGEQSAFHEAFGDCFAIMAALEDEPTRSALLAGDLLRRRNFVATTAEDLSHGIGALIDPGHNAASPRSALNDFQWTLPSALPMQGGPGALINESHSFGMIFSGCFYDTLTNIFAAGADQTEAGLLAASRTAGRILVAGARSAPLQARFFRAVGNAMILADRSLHAGANAEAIRAGFARHGIALDAERMLTPTSVLSGRPPAAPTGGLREVITRASQRDLAGIIGAARQRRFLATSFELGPEPVAAVRHQHKAPLGDVSERLEGVVCIVEEDVLIGAADGRAAALGAVPDAPTAVAEAQNFVCSLAHAGRIAPRRDAPGTRGRDAPDLGATHAVRRIGGERRLVRTRFACGCGCGRSGA